MDTSKTELLDKIRKVIAEVLNVSLEEIVPGFSFGDIPQWDSMGHMEVMLALEEGFGVAVNADTIGELVSLPIIVEHISKSGHV